MFHVFNGIQTFWRDNKNNHLYRREETFAALCHKHSYLSGCTLLFAVLIILWLNLDSLQHLLNNIPPYTFFSMSFNQKIFFEVFYYFNQERLYEYISCFIYSLIIFYIHRLIDLKKEIIKITIVICDKVSKEFT